MGVGRIEAGNSRLWYEEEGEGPAVVLLHAEAADSRMWDAQWHALTRHFRVIRVDLPGAGRSPYADEPKTGDGLLESLLHALGLERAALVGAGLGALLALDFTIRHPARVWALVAAAASPFGPGGVGTDLRAAEVLTLLAAGRPARAADRFLDVCCPLRTSAATDAAIRTMVHENIGMLTQLLRARVVVAGTWPAGCAAARDVPVLVVWGDRDAPAAQEAARRLAAGPAHAVVVVLPGVDHFVAMRAPERFTGDLLAFLRQAAPTESAPPAPGRRVVAGPDAGSERGGT